MNTYGKRAVVMSAVTIGTLVLFAALAVTLVKPQTLRADELPDSVPDSFAVCYYDLEEDFGCSTLTRDECHLHATKCGWGIGRCMPISEYKCRYKWSQVGYSKYCVRGDGEAFPAFSETERCQGPGSNRYVSFHYFNERLEAAGLDPVAEFMAKISDIIALVHLENGRGHAVRHVSIQDTASYLFNDIPNRLFADLENSILDVYGDWDEFSSGRFPANFQVYITANQTKSWSSSHINTPEMQPRFTFRLTKQADIDQYFPVSCEEIGGLYLKPVDWIPGLQTICALHTNDQCERREFVDPTPGGGVTAYWERIAGSTCNGETDLP